MPFELVFGRLLASSPTLRLLLENLVAVHPRDVAGLTCRAVIQFAPSLLELPLVPLSLQESPDQCLNLHKALVHLEKVLFIWLITLLLLWDGARFIQSVRFRVQVVLFDLFDCWLRRSLFVLDPGARDVLGVDLLLGAGFKDE